MPDITLTSDDAVTSDLMRKVVDDVGAAIERTVTIAPLPIPVVASGGSVAIGMMAALLEQLADDHVPGSKPDPECIFLAALIIARMGTQHDDPIGQAYRDLEALKPVE